MYSEKILECYVITSMLRVSAINTTNTSNVTPYVQYIKFVPEGQTFSRNTLFPSKQRIHPVRLSIFLKAQLLLKE